MADVPNSTLEAEQDLDYTYSFDYDYGLLDDDTVATSTATATTEASTEAIGQGATASTATATTTASTQATGTGETAATSLVQTSASTTATTGALATSTATAQSTASTVLADAEGPNLPVQYRLLVTANPKTTSLTLIQLRIRPTPSQTLPLPRLTTRVARSLRNTAVARELTLGFQTTEALVSRTNLQASSSNAES